jgi:hypothetical protein
MTATPNNGPVATGATMVTSSWTTMKDPYARGGKAAGQESKSTSR